MEIAPEPSVVIQQETKVKINLLPALTGVRFFAVLHIFMFHLSALYNADKHEKFS